MERKLSSLEKARIATAKSIEEKRSGTSGSDSESLTKDIPFSHPKARNQNGGLIQQLREQLGEIEAQMQNASPLMKASLASAKSTLQQKISDLEHGSPSREIDHDI